MRFLTSYLGHFTRVLVIYGMLFGFFKLKSTFWNFFLIGVIDATFLTLVKYFIRKKEAS